MGATNHTTNYNLPQFVGSDKPTWLGDVNGAMLAIDTQMKANATASSTADTKADTALTNASTAQTTATSAQTTADSASSTATSALNKALANESAISGLSVYSTSETDTNQKWIDNKTIYRKVIEITNSADLSPSSALYHSYATGISNVSQLISLQAIAHQADGDFDIMTRSNLYVVGFSSGNIKYLIGNDYTGAYAIDKIEFIFEYTKTAE